MASTEPVIENLKKEKKEKILSPVSLCLNVLMQQSESVC